MINYDKYNAFTLQVSFFTSLLIPFREIRMYISNETIIRTQYKNQSCILITSFAKPYEQ